MTNSGEPDALALLRERLSRVEEATTQSAKLIDQHADVINNALKPRELQSEVLQMLERVESIIEKLFDGGHTYTTVVLGAAYAGLFALWSFVRSSSSDRIMAYAGILILVSLSVFVLTEVVNVVLRAVMQFEVAKIKKPTTTEEIGEYMEALGKATGKRQLGANVYLFEAFCSLIPGVTAAIILFVTLLQMILK